MIANYPLFRSSVLCRVVEFLVAVAREALSEKTLIARLAPVGALEKQIVKCPLDWAVSSRAVDAVAAAIRAAGR